MKLWLVREPQGKIYGDLLEFCRRHSQRASLVIHKGALPSSNVFNFIRQSDEFILERKEQSSWPGGGTLAGTETVVYFAVTSAFIEQLKNAAFRLYDWVHPFLPEDLAFYRDNGDVLLAVIGHEKAAFLIVDDDERQELMEFIPDLQFTTDPSI